MYYVHYMIKDLFPEDLTPDFVAGPYDSQSEAYDHADDISGYEGVYNVRVIYEHEIR